MKHKLPVAAIVVLLSCFSFIVTAQDFWQILNSPKIVNGAYLKGVTSDTMGSIYVACANTNFNGGVYRSDDDAQTWQRKNNGIENPDASVRAIDLDKEGIIFAAGQTMIYKSNDRAESWVPFDFSADGLNFYTIKCGYDSIILAGGVDQSTIVRSGDHGNTWKIVYKNWQTDYFTSITDICFGPDGVIYASEHKFWVSEPGAVYASYDLGNTWQLFSDFYYPTALGFDTTGRLLAGDFGTGIYRYDINTQQWTWVLQQCVTPESFLTLPNGKILVACSYQPCYKSGVFLSDDNGETYNFINSGISINATYKKVCSDTLNRVLLLGGWLYRSVESLVSNKNQHTSNSNIECYPNPFHNNFTITLENYFLNDPITIMLYDCNGALIDQKEFTGNSFSYTNEFLKPGIYFVNIKSTSFTTHHKLIHY